MVAMLDDITREKSLVLSSDASSRNSMSACSQYEIKQVQMQAQENGRFFFCVGFCFCLCQLGSLVKTKLNDKSSNKTH